jgi:hypothetical protein
MTLCNAVSAENSKRSVLNMDLGQACEVVLSPFFNSISFLYYVSLPAQIHLLRFTLNLSGTERLKKV